MPTKQWHTGGADFGDGDGGAYRYRLWRVWDETRPRLLWVLLNPSTADDQTDDPTVRRCIDYTCRERIAGGEERYGGLEIVNLFAFRTPDPQNLRPDPQNRRQALDLIGADNDRWIVDAAARAQEIVVGWGEQGVYYDRDCAALELLADHLTQPLLCLDTVRNGCPRHPLRCARSTPFMPYVSAYTAYPVRRC